MSVATKIQSLDIEFANIRIGRVLLGVLVAIYQLVVYEGLSVYNSLRLSQSSNLWNISTQLDEMVPLVPEFAWIYFTYIPALIFPALLNLPFALFIRYAIALVLAVTLSGICFAVLPVIYVHTPFNCQELSCSALALLRSIDSGTNILPSLHASQSLLAVIALAYSGLRIGQLPIFILLAIIWYLPIIASTLFTHQHYVVDLIAGFVVAIICWKLAEKINSGVL